MESFFNHRNSINIRLLLRIIGWLLMIESGFMLVPLIVGICFNDGSWLPFLISIAVTGSAGGLMMSLKPSSREMGKREAILLTGLIWVILSLFGMIPFMTCSTHLSFTDAFFETMSGFTTTGATVLNSLNYVPKSILIWRSLVQWIGGLGIILFTLAVVPVLNYKGGMQLFNAEVTGITHDKLRPRVSFTAQGLWLVYIILTILLIILLIPSDLSFFDSVCYGLSTMSTGGFANSDKALHDWDSIYIKVILMIFMFLGGVNFSLIFKACTGNIKTALKNDVLKWYIAITLICYGLLTLNYVLTQQIDSWEDVTIDPLFQSISILSSTGLTEPDFFDWGPLAIVVLILMMFIGACAGSTSGGAKIDRILILLKFIKNEFFKLSHPRAVTTVTINGKGTNYQLVQKVLAFLFVYIFVIIISGILLVIIGLPLKESFFCSLSAISNTGLGTDITGLSGNYSLVPNSAKWVLSLVMLTGRLELYTILLLFTPAFWKK